jgi:myo-inositol 2-dehydrogenase/D-chiro-inositol 1-dehydrogenase
MMNERVLGIVVVGSGYMGRIHAESFARRVKGARLTAIAVGSRAPQLAQSYGVPAEPSLEALLARPDVDAIVVTTPEEAHLDEVRKAAAAGKHMLVEKPMAADLAQCDAMIKACKEAGITYMQVQSQRFRPVHRKVRELIDEGRIGEVWQVFSFATLAAKWTKDVIEARPWYVDPANGGLMMSHCVHSFDLMRWLAGSEAQRISAYGRTYGDSPAKDLSFQAQIVFANGVGGQLWVSMETPGAAFPQSAFRTQVIGSRGLLDFDSFSHLDLGTPDGQWERIIEVGPYLHLDLLDPKRVGAFYTQAQEFVDAIREQRQPSVTGADGRAAVEMWEAASRANYSGQTVGLPL